MISEMSLLVRREVLAEVVGQGVELLAPAVSIEGPELRPPVPSSVSPDIAVPSDEGAVQEVSHHGPHQHRRGEDHVHDVVELRRRGRRESERERQDGSSFHVVTMRTALEPV